MHKTSSYHILRVGLGITFLWVGILILREPLSWGGFIHPWVENLLPISLESAMIATAVMDIVIGLLLLVDRATWIAAVIGAFHMVIILVTSGINAITVRDIGLLAGLIAVSWDAMPLTMKKWIRKS